MTRRIFLDTEWTASPWSDRPKLMWSGLADEEGRTWYGISSEVEIDPSTNDFISGVFRLITPDERSRQPSSTSVAGWASSGRGAQRSRGFAEWFGLGDEASEVFEKCWNVDLQMLRGLVSPWPDGWPNRLHDLNAAAVAAGVEIPRRAVNHLHPRVHAEWNRRLFELIRASRSP